MTVPKWAQDRRLLVDRNITLTIAPRVDGGLMIHSDGLPGLNISHPSQRLALLDLGQAIITLLEQQRSGA